MDVGGDEAIGFSNELSHLDGIAYSHNGLGRSTDMLGNGYFDLAGDRQLLYGTTSRELHIVRVDAS